MRKLVVSTFLTLDGVMQAPGGPGEDDERRLRARWLVGELLGRADGRGHGRGDEHALRPAPRAQDVRHLRRVLAARPGGGRRASR